MIELHCRKADLHVKPLQAIGGQHTVALRLKTFQVMPTSDTKLLIELISAGTLVLFTSLAVSFTVTACAFRAACTCPQCQGDVMLAIGPSFALARPATRQAAAPHMSAQSANLG